MPAQKKLLLALLTLVVVFLIGTTGYRLIEDDVSFGQAAYMTIVVLSTVGIREEWDFSAASKFWTALIIVFGILVVMVAFTSLTAMIVGGELRGVMGRRKLQHQIGKLSGHYIVCGYGRMGKLIGDHLRRRGKNVVVVDLDSKRTLLAEETGLPYVLGDATNEETLRTAGIDRAGALVAALGGDAENVFVTLTAAGIREDMPIIARAEYLDSEPKLKRAGATHTVCPQAIGATRIANLLSRPAIVHLVDITTAGSEWELDEVRVPGDSALVGRSLKDLDLRGRHNVIVVAIRHGNGRTTVNPAAEQVVADDDVLVVIGPAGIAEAMLDLDSARGTGPERTSSPESPGRSRVSPLPGRRE